MRTSSSPVRHGCAKNALGGRSYRNIPLDEAASCSIPFTRGRTQQHQLQSLISPALVLPVFDLAILPAPLMLEPSLCGPARRGRQGRRGIKNSDELSSAQISAELSYGAAGRLPPL